MGLSGETGNNAFFCGGKEGGGERALGSRVMFKIISGACYGLCCASVDFFLSLNDQINKIH